MAPGDVLRPLDDDPVPQDIRAHGRMGFDDVIFHICQLPGFVQDRVRHADLPDVVQQRRVAQVVHPFPVPAQFLRHRHRVQADPRGMAFGIRVLGVDGVGQRLDRLEGHLLDLPAPFLRHGRLLFDFLVQPVGIVDLEQGRPVVLHHCHDGEGGQRRVHHREAHAERVCIINPEIIAERCEKNHSVKNGIVNGQDKTLPDPDKIAHADGQQNGPENARPLQVAGQGIESEHNAAEQCGNDDRLFPVLPEIGKIGAPGAGQQRHNAHDDLGNADLRLQHIHDQQHQPQNHRQHARRRQCHQVGFQPVAHKDRPAQERPPFLQRALSFPVFHRIHTIIPRRSSVQFIYTLSMIVILSPLSP